MRIFHLCNWTGESGGIKTLYDHVRLLRRAGYDAALASYGAFARCDWFEHDARAVPGRSELLELVRPDDLVVLPDFCMRDRELAEARCRQVVLVQNPDLMTGPADDPRYEALLVTSEPLVGWVRAEKGCTGPLHLVPGFLERELVLEPRRGVPASPRCLLVDRVDKHRGEPARARDALRSAGLPVHVLDERMPRTRFVRHFAEADVYLHLSYREGFPVSILEAFGAGCVVVGFSGRGGLHFMRPGENCLVVDDGDWRAATDAVAELLRAPPARWDALRRSARATALAHDEASSERALLAAFAALGTSSARRTTRDAAS
ncbi:MAG: glycosyltransferase [Planctomycetes bacterium]|nr:glycosyltransferase [Planctomycetota bacterium]